MIVFSTDSKFDFNEPENKAYIYNAEENPQIHLMGSILNEVELTYGDYIHVFYDSSHPEYIYITKCKDTDQCGGAKLSNVDYLRVSFRNKKLFELMKLPIKKGEQKDSKHSGYVVTLNKVKFLNRPCLRINLMEIEN